MGVRHIESQLIYLINSGGVLKILHHIPHYIIYWLHHYIITNVKSWNYVVYMW